MCVLADSLWSLTSLSNGYKMLEESVPKDVPGVFINESVKCSYCALMHHKDKERKRDNYTNVLTSMTHRMDEHTAVKSDHHITNILSSDISLDT